MITINFLVAEADTKWFNDFEIQFKHDLRCQLGTLNNINFVKNSDKKSNILIILYSNAFVKTLELPDNIEKPFILDLDGVKKESLIENIFGYTFFKENDKGIKLRYRTTTHNFLDKVVELAQDVTEQIDKMV